MKITVRDITRGPGTNIRVRFDTAAGPAAGVWRSAGEPRAGETYDVEFTLDRIPSIGSNAEKSNDRRSLLRLDGDVVTLNGLVESIDAERIGHLRLAPDALMMLDLADPRIDRGDWLRVTARIDELDVYAFSA